MRISGPPLCAMLLALTAILAGAGCRPRPAGRSARPAPEPFRVKETAAGSRPEQVLVADFDGDGVPDTLYLHVQEANPAPAGRAPGPRSQAIRVTVRSGSDGRWFTVIEDTWALEGRVSVSVAEGRRPPPFAVGVRESDERYWYRWDGHGYRQVEAVEGSYE